MWKARSRFLPTTLISVSAHVWAVLYSTLPSERCQERSAGPCLPSGHAPRNKSSSEGRSTSGHRSPRYREAKSNLLTNLMPPWLLVLLILRSASLYAAMAPGSIVTMATRNPGRARAPVRFRPTSLAFLAASAAYPPMDASRLSTTNPALAPGATSSTLSPEVPSAWELPWLVRLHE